MKKFLRAALDFLERKFPDRVIVRQAEYNAIRDSQAEARESIVKHEDRIKALELQMANMNVAMGFSVPKMGLLER